MLSDKRERIDADRNRKLAESYYKKEKNKE